jgi:Cupin domain
MPVAEDQLSFINHGHEEFFFVLNGAIECRLQTPDGLIIETLREGDSMYFWSSLPHCIRSARREPSDAIHVLCVAQSDRLTVDGKPYLETLVAGDACFIDSTVPHRFDGTDVNPFEPRTAEVLTVFWSPLGEAYLFDPDGPTTAA